MMSLYTDRLENTARDHGNFNQLVRRSRRNRLHERRQQSSQLRSGPQSIIMKFLLVISVVQFMNMKAIVSKRNFLENSQSLIYSFTLNSSTVRFVHGLTLPPNPYFVTNRCKSNLFRSGRGTVELAMATSSKDLKKQTETIANNMGDVESINIPAKSKTKGTKVQKGSSSSIASTKSSGASSKGRQKKAATKVSKAKKVTKQRDPSSVVVRLSKAAKEKAAAVSAEKKSRGRPKKNSASSSMEYAENSSGIDGARMDDFGANNDDGEERLGSVLDLARAIEEELELLQLAGPMMQRMRPIAVEPTFSLSNSRLNMMQHNADQEERQEREKLRNDRNRIHQLLAQQQQMQSELGDETRGIDQYDGTVGDSKAQMAISSESTSKSLPALPSTCHVAVVFPKPLLNGRITVEYASRLEALAHELGKKNEDGEPAYKPLLICLLSSDTSFTANGDHKASAVVDDGTAGYIYFQHLCEINNISLTDITVCIVPMHNKRSSGESNKSHYNSYDTDVMMTATSTVDYEVNGRDRKYRDSMLSIPTLDSVAREIQGNFLDTWLDQSQVYESKTDEYGMTRRQPRKKVHIHITLFSTDYQLCNLNDIHTRSPRQSPFKSVQSNILSSSSSSSSNALLSSSATRRRVIVETTWSFHYSAYPFREVHGNEVESFLGSCYLLAQDLQPLLVNLRGVVDNEEFFQRDNYRTLVAIRRLLVSMVEGMYRDIPNDNAYNSYIKDGDRLSVLESLWSSPLLTDGTSSTSLAEGGNDLRRRNEIRHHGPSLKSRLKNWNSGGRRVGEGSSLDVVLESALLSLGRCLDLVRPAGLMLAHTSVPKQDWKQALEQLEHFLDLIQSACDPDRPLDPREWGVMHRYGDQQRIQNSYSPSDLDHINLQSALEGVEVDHKD